MLKLFRRLPVWGLLLTLVLVALIPAIVLSYHSSIVKAKGDPHGHVPHISKQIHSLVAPSLSASTNTVSVYQTISVTGQGFDANETIRLQLDNINALVLKTLSSDNNGMFSGSITLPASSVVQGLHPLIATGIVSGLTAQTPLTFIASLSTTPLQGSAWTTITLNGGSFAPNEPIDIYWGKQQSPVHISTATADSAGNVSYTFSPPKGTIGGKYPITVYRFRQTPRNIGTTFQVIPPKMTTSLPGVHTGQSVQAQVKNFQPHETVAISWNANGGQQLATVVMDSTGAGSVSFTPSSASHGQYTLTAVGSSSIVQATGHLSIGPGIALSTSSAGASSTITVSGGGYTAGEMVSVYFQTLTNGVVSTTVGADGTFSTPLTVPAVYTSNINYAVYATGTVKGETANASFTFVPASLTCTSVCWTSYGGQSSFSGQGFAAKETVNIYWLYGQPGQTLAGTGTADAQGSFTANIASDPSAPQGYITVTAVGTTSYLSATTPANTMYENTNLILSTYSGSVGTSVKITAGGFHSSESVDIYFNGIDVLSSAVDASGALLSSFTVPPSRSGYFAIQMIGSISGTSVNTNFYVIPALILTSKYSSSSIIIDGSGFTPYSSVSLYLYNSNYNYIGNVSPSSVGAFEATFISGLAFGYSYTFCAYDSGLSQTVCASVTVQ